MTSGHLENNPVFKQNNVYKKGKLYTNSSYAILKLDTLILICAS